MVHYDELLEIGYRQCSLLGKLELESYHRV